MSNPGVPDAGGKRLLSISWHEAVRLIPTALHGYRGQMEATGVLAVGETTAAITYVKARRGVSPRQMKAILLVSKLAVGIPVGAWLSGSWSATALSVEFAVLGLGWLGGDPLAGGSFDAKGPRRTRTGLRAAA